MPFFDIVVFLGLAVSLPILFVKEILQEFNLCSRLLGNRVFRFVAVVVLTGIILLFGVLDGDKFIYFQF